MKKILFLFLFLLLPQICFAADTTRIVADCNSPGLSYSTNDQGRDYSMDSQGRLCLSPVCNLTATVSVTAAATTQIVALTAGQTIRVCAFSVSMSAAGTAQFVYGTGTNCGTGTTSITPAVPLATATPWTQSIGPGAVLFQTAAANALCVAAVTGNVVGYITYAKY